MAGEAAISQAASRRRASRAADAAADTRGVSLYVHVPFCASKCAYCDFYSMPIGQRPIPGDRRTLDEQGTFANPIDEYLAALGTLSLAEDILHDVPTLYIGGGTPTALRDRLVELLARLREHATFAEDAEITVEANPESTDVLLAEALVSAGVTRLSLGVQSFDSDVLAVLGRSHDDARAVAAARAVTGAGLALSVDLMCGIPGQTQASWRETLCRAVDTGAVHASVYPLALEGGTVLQHDVAAGRLPEPDTDLAAEMMLAAEEVLGDAGLRRYETANYARVGYESRHNTRYWTGGQYLGVGPSAASMLSPATLSRLAVLGPLTLAHLHRGADESGRVRFSANRSIVDFVREGLDRAAAESEYLTEREAAREDVMLGLRLVAGVSGALVERAGAAVREALCELEAEGLVERSPEGGWQATPRGWLLGNEVFAAVWTAEDS